MDLSNIKAFAFDIDGVFTDGSILCDLTGELFRTYDAKDGFAVRMATMKGFPVAIITGGRSASIRNRFKQCGVLETNVYLGSRNKIEDLDDFCLKYGIGRENVLYAGDDIPDMECICISGVGACPCDAVDEAKSVADYISTKPGGKGFVRDCITMVLKAQDKWDFDVQMYKKLF